MSRRSTGFVGVWAEMQRQQQRQQEADARRRRQEEQRARAHQRRVERDHREYRKAEALRRTEELDARVESLRALLASGCRAQPFRAATLLRPETVQPFAPGPLAQPVPMPDERYYQPQGGGWTANRRAQAQAEARARFERDWHAAQAAEAQRQRQLAAYQRQYQEWADAQLAEVRRHNAGVTATVEGVRQREPDAVIEYFSAALYSSTAWPEGFPRQVAAAYDPAAGQLVLDWELPACDVVPEVKAVRYMASVDQDKETPRPVGQRRALYREVLVQCMLLVLHELFAADEQGALESVALNGFVDGHDPTTGRPGQIFLATPSWPSAPRSRSCTWPRWTRRAASPTRCADRSRPAPTSSPPYGPAGGRRTSATGSSPTAATRIPTCSPWTRWPSRTWSPTSSAPWACRR